MKPASNHKEKTTFTLRLNNNLYKKLKEVAQKEKRSMAKQIELFLEKGLSNN